VEVPTNKVERIVEVEANPKKEETKNVEKKPSIRINSDLENPEEVMKRYPTYSPKLAMMMAKSKQKNSSLTDSRIVELKKKAKDMKESLPKSEIRDFIANKKKRI